MEPTEDDRRKFYVTQTRFQTQFDGNQYLKNGNLLQHNIDISKPQPLSSAQVSESIFLSLQQTTVDFSNQFIPFVGEKASDIETY